jgi:hypothetical protein
MPDRSNRRWGSVRYYPPLAMKPYETPLECSTPLPKYDIAIKPISPQLQANKDQPIASANTTATASRVTDSFEYERTSESD